MLGLLMDSPSRGRLDAGIPSSLAHPLHDPAPVSGAGEDAAASASDIADPLRREPLHPMPRFSGEGM
ncbi:hypothetical protein B8W74_04040 [Arthrobacter agilis]|nr:hypothetical protein B8W74_04040 [Arthrobacter agilis]